MQLVFDMLVLQKHSMEMTVAAGEALYTLVCLHQVSGIPPQNRWCTGVLCRCPVTRGVAVCQVEYSELVEALLASQRDAVIYQRLADAFNKLSASSTPPTMDRKQKVAFLKSLEEFVSNVGGLLCVK